MKYEGVLYRPPSEAYSLIIQVTIGCAHNKCTFCNMYKDKKFRIRSLDEIFKDLEEAKIYYGDVKRVFLADGDALIVKTENLKKILLKIKELFPSCERVSTYGAPKDILKKPLEDLIELRKLGMKMVYLGVESGSDKILKHIKKGVTAKEMIEAGKKIKDSGIKLSTTLISGLGGKEDLKEHAVESGKVISEINPDYLGLLTLMIEKNTEIYKEIKNKKIKLLNPVEVMIETKIFIENTKVNNCVFRSNHASNYIPLAGILCEDKQWILQIIDECIKGQHDFKNEQFRAL